MRRLFLLSILLSLAAGLFVAIGCDKLITQVNNNNVYDSTLGQDCKRCHGDDDRIIRLPQAQWANSRHASPDLIEAMVLLNGEGFLTSECGKRCHTSEGFRKYSANDSTSAVTQPSVIDCFTCHLPHTGNYGAWSMDTLRGDRETTNLGNFTYYSAGASNMCAICHSARHVPVFSTTPGTVKLDSIGEDGPHFSAQANMMIGTGGARFGQTVVTNSHNSVNDTLKDGCLACHFGTGRGYDFGEHTFKLKNQSTQEEYVANCNVSGCHSGLLLITDLHDELKFPRLDSVRLLGDSLKNLLLAFPVLSGTGADTTDFYRDSTVPTDVAKILYNYLLYKGDGSRGVHNTKYTLQLLKESVEQWDSIPRAAFSASINRICTGNSIDFQNLSLGAIATSTWDFGDGTAPEQVAGAGDASHLYAKAGTFPVTLSITGSAGIASKSSSVIIDTIPEALFVISPAELFVDSTVTFTDQSGRGPTGWEWDFGDGVGTSNAQNPQYVFTSNGQFEIRLIASNACGPDTLFDTVTVITPPPALLGRK
jgi:PKD repeat protein